MNSQKDIEGIQLIAELNNCRRDLLDDVVQIRKLVSSGISACGFHQMSIAAQKFHPIGVTVIAIVSESHVAVHTYPEANHVSLDIFHCSADSARMLKLMAFFQDGFEAESLKFIEIARGNNLEVRRGDITTPQRTPVSTGTSS